MTIIFPSSSLSSRVIISLFRWCITCCKEWKLNSGWHWPRCRWNDQWCSWIAWVSIFSQRCEWMVIYFIDTEIYTRSKARVANRKCERWIFTSEETFDVALLTELLQTKGEIAEISPAELNELWSELILTIRTKEGEDYELWSLPGMVASFERHLKRKSLSSQHHHSSMTW